jgi:hypothetical protein
MPFRQLVCEATKCRILIDETAFWHGRHFAADLLIFVRGLFFG